MADRGWQMAEHEQRFFAICHLPSAIQSRGMAVFTPVFGTLA